MKKWMTMLMFGGALSLTGFVQTSTTDAAAVAPPAPAATTGETEPCQWCCPLHICGMNGPSFDGTTEAASCSAR